MADVKKIGLGTAQFGLDYGISNATGQVPENEVERILRGARAERIDTLDTAALYGDAESVLGDVIDNHAEFKIISKTVGVDEDEVTPVEVYRIKQTIHKSLLRLKTASIYGLLVHDVNDLFKPHSERLIEMLRQCQQNGKVKKIGVSIYTGEQIDRVLELFTPDLVQVPGSIIDQRLVRSGHLTKLKEYGVEIHLRSAFLQGLLLMPPDQLNPYFEPIKEHLSAYHEYLEENNVTPLQSALQYALSLDEIDRVIVGVCSRSELTGVIEATKKSLPEQFEFDRWGVNTPAFVNPAEWRLIPELV